MITEYVRKYTDPVNEFIFNHLYIILVIIAVIIFSRIYLRIRGYFLKKKADKTGNYSTNEWFKIDED